MTYFFGRMAGANPAPSGTPKVEFARVEGHECLQPVLYGTGALLADYRAAEVRWLNSKYPGVPFPRAKTEILLLPAADGDAQREGTEVQRETFYLDGIVGDGAATCFDINLVTGPAESHE